MRPRARARTCSLTCLDETEASTRALSPSARSHSALPRLRPRSAAAHPHASTLWSGPSASLQGHSWAAGTLLSHTITNDLFFALWTESYMRYKDSNELPSM
eukprot:5085507-Pleurochrysis_carterae.AAC.2